MTNATNQSAYTSVTVLKSNYMYNKQLTSSVGRMRPRKMYINEGFTCLNFLKEINLMAMNWET